MLHRTTLEKPKYVSRTLVLFAALAVVAMAPGVDAQVCLDGGNLTTNCGFVSDESGWTLVLGTSFSQVPIIGNQGPGSGEGVAEDIGMGFGFEFMQCVSGVAGDTGYGFGLAITATVGPISTCSIQATEYDDGACGTSLASNSESINTFSSGWNDLKGTFTSHTDTSSVLIQINCWNDSGFTVGVDDIYLGPGLDLPVDLSGFTVE